MKKILLLLALAAGTAHAATRYEYIPVPMNMGKPCIIKFGDKVMVNLHSVSVYRYYGKELPRYTDSDWKDNTVLLIGDRVVQRVQGNALAIIEARLKECEK